MRKNSRLPIYILGGVVVLSVGVLLIGRDGGASVGAGVLLHGARTANVGESVGGGDGNLAPDFTLRTLDGQNLTLSSYRGEKSVILDFFATWCPNCRRNIPHEARLYERYKDSIEVIGVNLRENHNLVKSFADKYAVGFPVVLDPVGLAANLYGVRYTNFKVLINKEGFLVRFVPGDISESDFKSLIGV